MNKATLVLSFAAFLLLLMVLKIPLVSWASENIDANTAEAIVYERHIIVEKTLYAFSGVVYVGSFNASEDDYVKLDIVATSTDSHLTELTITSTNHGIIFVNETNEFNQTISLDYADTYNVTISKRPFYSTVTVSGTIDIINEKEVPPPDEEAPTPSPSPTATLTPTSASTVSPTPSPSYSATPNSSITPSPSVPEFQSIMVVSLIIVITMLGALIWKTKKRTA